MSAPADALGRRRRGRVERPGGRCPPVHQQRLVLVVLVEQAEAADVAPLAVVGVEAAEREAVLGGPEGGEPVGVHRRRGVTLGQGLRGADGLVVQDVVEPARRLGPPGVQPLVEHLDVSLLVFDAVPGLLGPIDALARSGRAVRHRGSPSTRERNGGLRTYQRVSFPVAGRG
jgi:hypothetical protein